MRPWVGHASSRGSVLLDLATFRAWQGQDSRKVLDASLAAFQEAGVDQVIFMQQAGRNRHEHIRQSLELFAAEVMPAFAADRAAREARKAAELAPFIAAAMKRKRWMKPLEDHEIPVVRASVAKAQVSGAQV